jgi:hypothetical protein
MKRFVFAAAALAVSAGLFTSVASASVGAKSSSKVARTVTEWTATYDASQYYGGVTCTGKTIVSAKYPEGKEVETCESTELHLTDMQAGKGQTSFKNTSGGSVGEWESDSGSGKKTTDFSYSVNKQLTKFKIVAIY